MTTSRTSCSLCVVSVGHHFDDRAHCARQTPRLSAGLKSQVHQTDTEHMHDPASLHRDPFNLRADLNVNCVQQVPQAVLKKCETPFAAPPCAIVFGDGLCSKATNRPHSLLVQHEEKPRGFAALCHGWLRCWRMAAAAC